MKRPLILIAILSTLLALAAAREARATGCDDLGGQVVGTECQLSDSVKKSGTFDIDQTLRITSSGKITVPAATGGNTLTINVCAAPAACDFIMEPGAQILGNVKGADNKSGIGAAISISATRNILLQGTGSDGALISSNQKAGSCTGGRAGDISLIAAVDVNVQAGAVVSADGTPCPGGSIKLIAATGNVTTTGLISSVSTMSGTGAVQPPGGGPITIIARCNLAAGGTIQSEGSDAGADLIHLEAGCSVVIDGLVASTGAGHAPPNSPGNHCFGPDLQNPSRPDKPANSTACIEVWSGGVITINATAELNADTGSNGGNTGVSWIDLFARGDISIKGDSTLPFAVHANGIGGSGGNGETGGIVTVKSKAGSVSAQGDALQASATKNNNDDGGQITVQAAVNVNLSGSTPTVEAKGKDTGGSIAARAFTGALSWLSGVGDVRPDATGTIALTACGAINTTGTNFNGEVPTTSTGVCADPSPTLPAYVVLPSCICGNIPLPPGQGCPEDPNRVLTWTVDPAGAHGGLPNSLTLQDAATNASSGNVIGVFANTTENVLVSNKELTITQCTLGKITAADAGKAVVAISGFDPVLVIGLDTFGGTVGWLLGGSGHELRGVRAAGASLFGIEVDGDSNRVSFNSVSGNGAGVDVEGSGNNVRGGTIEQNSGDGIAFGAAATGNVLQGATIQNNAGNGIAVAGDGNTIRDNARVDQNGKNGILVSGSGNLIKGNTAGSSAGKGNQQDGFHVTGPGNTFDSNRSSANLGDGFDIAGGTAAQPNILKGNQSNQNNSGSTKENVGPEYRLLGTIKSLGGNKADNVSIPKSTKCRSFPGKNKTTDFTTEYTCGD